VWEGWLLGEWNREESRDTLEIVFGFTRRTPLLCFSCPAVASRGLAAVSRLRGLLLALLNFPRYPHPRPFLSISTTARLAASKKEQRAWATRSTDIVEVRVTLSRWCGT
jgi:hypothetical protein